MSACCFRAAPVALLLGFHVLPAVAGSLSLGTPVVQNNQYTFPVNLQGEGEGVAALDFRLAYDPAVFAPVSAQTGNSAATAQKQVSSNVAEPGEFIVVMMGFNQNVVQPGTVVQVVMEKIGEPANGQSELAISEPTMATNEGVEIDSIGHTSVVKFGDEKTEPDPAVEKPTTPEDKDTDVKTPETPGESKPDAVAKPSGGFRMIVAEQTENKAKGPGTPGKPGEPVSKPGGATASTPAGNPPAAADSTALPSGDAPVAPATAKSSPTPAAVPDSTPVLEGNDNTAPDAMLTSKSPAEKPAAAPETEETGNRGALFVTLLAVALALPVSALVLLKMLR